MASTMALLSMQLTSYVAPLSICARKVWTSEHCCDSVNIYSTVGHAMFKFFTHKIVTQCDF